MIIPFLVWNSYRFGMKFIPLWYDINTVFGMKFIPFLVWNSYRFWYAQCKKRNHTYFGMNFIPLFLLCINSFTGPPQQWKLLSPSFLVHKQACTCFTARPCRLKRCCRMFPAYKQVCTSCTGPPQRFLYLYLNFQRPARASQPLFSGENGVAWRFPHINRLAPASKDLPSSENCFLSLSCNRS